MARVSAKHSLCTVAAVLLAGAASSPAQDLFQNAGSFQIGERPRSLAVGDVTGDGLPDLAVANVGSFSEQTRRFVGRTLSVFENDGSGGFSELFVEEVTDIPLAVAIADMDGDSRLDVLLATADDGITIYLNNGDGLIAIGPFPCGALPVAITLADLNGDSRLDVVTADNESDTVSVLLGNGDGTLSAARSFVAGSAPTALSVGDFNGDEFPEVIVANNLDDTVSVFLGSVDGLEFSETLQVGASPRAIAIGFLNDDSHLDFAVGNFVGKSVSIFHGDGNGAFDSPETLSVGSEVSALSSFDLNADGVDELFLALDDNTFRVYERAPNGFTLAESHTTGETPISLIISDLNTDTYDDVAVAAFNEGTITLFWQVAPISEGDGEPSTEGDGESSTEGDGESSTEGDGEPSTEGDGESSTEGDGESSTEGEGESPEEGEGEPLDGGGEGQAEGEPIQISCAPSPGALTQQPFEAGVGDLILIAATVLAFSYIPKRHGV